jgi:alcohol dehydrogenase
MNAFQAFLLEQGTDRQVQGRMVDFDPDQLDAGEVLIRVAYSSINYKDALAATGKGKIIRRFPCIGGIDLSGVVSASSDARFQPGDAVLATSFDIGVSHHGGYAQYARIPADWVIPLPAGLGLQESMALGTAGFTAALAITRMEQNGLTPGKGPVLVTGATGGVGSLATNMLAQCGYTVTALTGKEEETDYLKKLGASEILLRQSIEFDQAKFLESARWAGAVDNTGGQILAWLLASMQQAGTVASVGNAASFHLNTTVFPFILRGVSLLGIDSGYMGNPLRTQVWQRLGSELKPQSLGSMTKTIDFAQLPAAFSAFIEGKVKGRIVVQIGED